MLYKVERDHVGLVIPEDNGILTLHRRLGPQAYSCGHHPRFDLLQRCYWATALRRQAAHLL